MAMRVDSECLIDETLRFLIASSNEKLISVKLIVNADPRSTVRQLLQYTYHKIYERVQVEDATMKVMDSSDGDENDMFSLGHVSEYCLSFEDQVLDVSQTLSDNFNDTRKSFIRLYFEACPKGFKHTIPVDYLSSKSFTQTTLHTNLNLLGPTKTLRLIQSDVPLETKLFKLKQMVIEQLISYELSQFGKDSCGLKKKHNVNDLIELKLNGKSMKIYLNEAKGSEIYDELTLSELFNISFPPYKSSYLKLSFNVLHNRDVFTPQEQHLITFNSDVALTTNKMLITPQTTLYDVKDYICSIYANSLRLYHQDIDIYYHDTRLSTKDSTDTDDPVIEIINEKENIVFDIRINQDYSEPGPGFWVELFNSPQRFNFMYAGQFWETQSNRIMQRRGLSGSRGQDGGKNGHTDNTPCNLQYVTEDGSQIQRTGIMYSECTIANDKKGFILSSDILSSNQKKFEINDQIIAADEISYVVNNNTIRITDSLKSKLNNADNEAKQINSTIVSPTTRGIIRNRRDRNISANFQELISFIDFELRHYYPLFSALYRIFILLCFNIAFQAYLIYEFQKLFPQKVSIPLTIFVSFKIMITMRETKLIWSSYLQSRKTSWNPEIQELIYQIKHNKFEEKFYKKFKTSYKHNEIILHPILKNSRTRIYSACDLEIPTTLQHDQEQLKIVIERIIAKKASKQLLDNLLLDCLKSSIYFSEPKAQVKLNNFLAFLKKEIRS